MTTPRDAQGINVAQLIEPAPHRVRLEIDEFLGDNDMTNLFLLALQEMHKENADLKGDKEDWWTHYSLASIHSAPKEPWNKIKKWTSGVEGDYCTHGMLMFPTWHRVYIGMYEQAVYNKMTDIANQWTNEHERTKYLQAADRFRLPFWDPLLPRNKVTPIIGKDLNNKIWGAPLILTKPKVYVKKPNEKTQTEIDNPLASFKWPIEELKKKGRVPINGDVTKRLPDWTRRRQSTFRGEEPLNSHIQSQGKSLGTKLWKLLAPHSSQVFTDRAVWDSTKEWQGVDNAERSWNEFACHAVYNPVNGRTGASISSAVSLESWHDEIHVLVGGTMGQIPTAAFDPIFWLHHNNIDRLFAIFQAIYDDKWIPQTGKQNGIMELYPFHKDETNYWNSNDTKDWTKLGYAIPGDRPLDLSGKEAVKNYVKEYYQWIAQGSAPGESVTANWPRDLSRSYALLGDVVEVQAQPILLFQAIAPTGLVTRSVEVATPESPEIAVKEEPTVVSQAVVEPVALPTLFNELTLMAPPVFDKPVMVQLTWNARVSVRKFAFGGPFTIHLFIGKPDDSHPEGFIDRENEVGLSFIFASPPESSCQNCANQTAEGLLFEDAIPITHALYYYLQEGNTRPVDQWPRPEMRTLETFQPEHVVPYLQKNLSWRIIDSENNIISDQERIIASKLEISVSTREYQLPSEQNPLGVYGPATTYPEITAGKLGGSPTTTQAE